MGPERLSKLSRVAARSAEPGVRRQDPCCQCRVIPTAFLDISGQNSCMGYRLLDAVTRTSLTNSLRLLGVSCCFSDEEIEAGSLRNRVTTQLVSGLGDRFPWLGLSLCSLLPPTFRVSSASFWSPLRSLRGSEREQRRAFEFLNQAQHLRAGVQIFLPDE